jgi:hypothetical protein
LFLQQGHLALNGSEFALIIFVSFGGFPSRFFGGAVLAGVVLSHDDGVED